MPIIHWRKQVALDFRHSDATPCVQIAASFPDDGASQRFAVLIAVRRCVVGKAGREGFDFRGSVLAPPKTAGRGCAPLPRSVLGAGAPALPTPLSRFGARRRQTASAAALRFHGSVLAPSQTAGRGLRFRLPRVGHCRIMSYMPRIPATRRQAARTHGRQDRGRVGALDYACQQRISNHSTQAKA